MSAERTPTPRQSVTDSRLAELRLAIREEVSVEVVAVLLRRPQRSPHAPAALADSHRVAKHAQRDLPLAHVGVTEPGASAPRVRRDLVGPQGRVDQRAGLAAGDLRRRWERNSEESQGNLDSGGWAEAALSHAGRQRRKRMTTVARQTGGGRKPSPKVFDDDHALREVVRQFGPAQTSRQDGINIHEWIRPGGDGAVFARMSGREVQSGETAARQLEVILAALKPHGKVPRAVVLTLDNSGFNDYDKRPDYWLTEQYLQEGWLKWVAWRGVDRMTREHYPGSQYIHLLKTSGTELFLAEMSRTVDWEQDELQIRALMMAYNVEGQQIKKRTHGRLKSGWLETQRGWPGCQRFGSDRSKLDNYIIEDPEGAQVVSYIHHRFADLQTQNRSGRRELVVGVEREFGMKLSEGTINKILRDPFYVTGEMWVMYEGQAYQVRPVQWTNPVPLEVFQRNQELLRLRRGRNTRTDVGQFCLNGLLVHETCQHMRVGNGRGKVPKLRGRNRARNKTPTYYHTPNTPACCQGFTVLQTHIEPLVMQQLRRVLTEPELIEAWRTSDRAPGRVDNGPLLAEPAREQIRSKIDNIGVQKSNLHREMVTLAEAGKDVSGTHYAQLIEALEDRTNVLRRQLALDEKARRSAPKLQTVQLQQATEDALIERACELLTDTVPDDPEMKLARAALVSTLLSRVVVSENKDGRLQVELHGWLVPGEADGTNDPRTAADVIWVEAAGSATLSDLASAAQLDAQGLDPDESASAAVPTGLQSSTCKPVGTSAKLPAPTSWSRVERRLLGDFTVEETVVTEPLVGSSPWNNKLPSDDPWGDLHAMNARRERRSSKGDGPSWVSPPAVLSVAAVGVGKGQLDVEQTRRFLRRAAEAVPAGLDRMTVDWYSARTCVDHSLPGAQAARAALRAEGLSFEYAVYEALRDVRVGSGLPVRPPKCGPEFRDRRAVVA